MTDKNNEPVVQTLDDVPAHLNFLDYAYLLDSPDFPDSPESITSMSDVDMLDMDYTPSISNAIKETKDYGSCTVKGNRSDDAKYGFEAIVNDDPEELVRPPLKVENAGSEYRPSKTLPHYAQDNIKFLIDVSLSL